MRIAWVSPMPPQRTGIADYSAALLPYLSADLGHVEVYTPEPSRGWDGVASGYSLSALPDRWRTYELCLYHLGNNQLFHSDIYSLALTYPGVTVLHDFFLHHLVAGMTIGRGHFAAYLREMAYAEGADGVEQAYRAELDWAQMPLFNEPLVARLLDVSLGVVVHSRYALELARRRRPDLHIAYVPAPLGPEQPDALSRAELGLPEEAFIVTIAGMPNASKHTDTVLRAVSMLSDGFPHLHCALVGEVLEDADLGAWPGIRDRFLEIGYQPSLSRFLAYLQASDLIVNLRYPSVGEASALTLRAMGLGKPVIVSNVGWYADLPTDSCAKFAHSVDVEADAEALAGLIAVLIQQPDTARLIGDRGRSYVRREHALAGVASAYSDVLNSWKDELYGRHSLAADRG